LSFIHHYIIIQWKGGGGKERTFRFKEWDRSACLQGSAKLQKWWRLGLLFAKEEEEKDSWDMRKRNKEEGFIYTLVDLQKYVSYFE
jgi:hypothetical protein